MICYFVGLGCCVYNLVFGVNTYTLAFAGYCSLLPKGIESEQQAAQGRDEPAYDNFRNGQA
ncbi:hypothetical protein GCM10017567_35270 [Amycolatopsis bullii]|uniref:Uncharacterized protein n=1 Tax=Amycolatopsis bullii TaxID=941987 RepID=A0ABQ3KCH3_9PSEU|nr:hypothetical protein GCM10017567_35270 [Amycolatopsis bullii]